MKLEGLAIGMSMDLLSKLKADRIRWLELQFTDFMGGLQHITVPSHAVSEAEVTKGFGKLDGSSIKGFKEIFESDMILKPDSDTYRKLPWQQDTARVLCTAVNSDGTEFTRDPRTVAMKTERHLAAEGYDKAYFGPEPEFFIFDDVKVNAHHPHAGQSYSIHSVESPWHQDNKGQFVNFKEGYYPACPVDTLTALRQEICATMEDNFGVPIDAHHHEVATAGQCEINMRYDTLTNMADNLATFKYVTRNVAHRYGKVATFMPKPIFGDNGSGMHVHSSLWKSGKNTFYDENEQYAQISQTGRYYIGGLIAHGRALSAIVAPTTNSYKRLVPGYEAPVNLAWSKCNRSAAVRIPANPGERAKRLEYRPADPAANGYFAFSAIVLAGLDGVKKKIEPGDPVDQNIWHLTKEKKKELGVKELPGSLTEAIAELESDNDFLKPVWTSDLIETHCQIKKEEDKQNSIRPTPWEFMQYLKA